MQRKSMELYKLLKKSFKLMTRGHNHKGLANPAQGVVLRELVDNGGKLTQKELLNLIDVRQATMSELLKKLSDKGLIEKSKAERDKRITYYEITPKGRALREENLKLEIERIEELFKSMDDHKMEKMIQLLGEMTHTWEEDQNIMSKGRGLLRDNK